MLLRFFGESGCKGQCALQKTLSNLAFLLRRGRIGPKFNSLLGAEDLAAGKALAQHDLETVRNAYTQLQRIMDDFNAVR